MPPPWPFAGLGRCCYTNESGSGQVQRVDASTVYADWEVCTKAEAEDGGDLVGIAAAGRKHSGGPAVPGGIAKVAVAKASASSSLGSRSGSGDVEAIADASSPVGRPSMGDGAALDGDSLGCGCAKTGNGEEPPDDLALRDMMQSFVTSMVRGRDVHIIVEAGRAALCHVSMSANLLHMQVSVQEQGSVYEIPLRSVKDVFSGDLGEDDAETIPLDELCTTLVLQNNDCLTFRLASLQERSDFTRCLIVLLRALDA